MDEKTEPLEQVAAETEVDQEKEVDEGTDEVEIDIIEDVVDVVDSDKDGDTFKEDEDEEQAANESTSPDKNGSYRIPKLSEKEDTEQEHPSDAELLVDETVEGQTETKLGGKDETETKSESPKTENSNGETKDKNKDNDTQHRKRSSTDRARSKSRDRSRSRSRERRRHGRSQDRELVITNSGSPDMVRSRLFIGHVNTDYVDKDDVLKLFSPYGKVIGITLNKGYGFVQYDNEQSAKAAIREVHGTPFGGAKIVVDKTVALKRMLGEDPRSEPPLPRDARDGHKRRDRSYDDNDEYMRRRYSRLDVLERYLYDQYDRYDRYDRYSSSGGLSRSRDSYYDSYYDRPPPSYSYERSHYSDLDRDRYSLRERDHYPPRPSSYYDRHREDRYDDYSRRPPPLSDDYDYYSSRRY